MTILIRAFHPSDTTAIKEITLAAFQGVTLEQDIENKLGILNGLDWRARKARHIDEDVATHAEGIFVAECEGTVIGYISTRIDHELGKGRIPNLAIAETFRGAGLGRQLIEVALEYFRRENLSYAIIETMAQNAIGDHLYRSCGFEEVARQIHFAKKLTD